MVTKNISRRILYDTRKKHWNQNPFMKLLVDSLPENVHGFGWSWTRAILGRYDIIHFHWPEYLLKMPSVLGKNAARLLFILFILRLKVTGTKVVRTRHNLSSHDSASKIDQYLVGLLQRMAVVEIRMNHARVEDIPSAPDCEIIYIPHGNYFPYLDATFSQWRAENDINKLNSDVVEFFCFGIIKPYKRFEDVIKAFDGLNGSRYSLEIAGQVADERYASMLMSLVASGDGRAKVSPGRLTDEDLIARISSASFIIVPYENVYNSGVVMLALSLRTVVIVRDSLAVRELEREFGRQWIRTYRDDLTDRTLTELATEGDNVHESGPTWASERSWESIGRKLATRVY